MDFESLIREYGYVALFVGTFLEGETILIIAGFMAYRGYLDLEWVIPVAFGGTFLSDQLFFYFGRWRGQAFVMGRPKWRRRAERIQPIIDRYHNYIILGFRFFYGLRNIVPLVLGSSGLSPLRYLILNSLGAAIWAVSFGVAGYLFGQAIKALLADIRQYERFILAGMALVGLILWLRHVLRSRKLEPVTSVPAPPQEVGSIRP